jgi:alpha-glucoside transport system permease protein
VPLQLALIPLLHGVASTTRCSGIEGMQGKGYLGVWLAHTGFGLPLAIYLLRNYMVGLPRDIIENAKVDGATDFQIFTKIVLPLSASPRWRASRSSSSCGPGTTSLSRKVFLDRRDGADDRDDEPDRGTPMGSRGGDWEILV